MRNIIFYLLCFINSPIHSQIEDTKLTNVDELYRFALHDLIEKSNLTLPYPVLINADDVILDAIESRFGNKILRIYGHDLIEAIKEFKNPEILIIRPIWVENGYFIVNLVFMKCSYKRKKKTLYFQNAGFRRYHFRYDCDKMNFTLAKITDDGA